MHEQSTETGRRCAYCGALFFPYPSVVAKGLGKFCSRGCSQLSRRQNEIEACTRCGAPVYRQPRARGRPYCSNACKLAAQRAAAEPTEQRFWRHVDKDGPLPAHRPELGACWVWTGYRNAHRRHYGVFIVRKRTGSAHRYSWLLANGPIPAGLLVLHRCDNPPCVRPDHLILGTHQDNMDDMWAKGRAAVQARASTATAHSPSS